MAWIIKLRYYSGIKPDYFRNTGHNIDWFTERKKKAKVFHSKKKAKKLAQLLQFRNQSNISFYIFEAKVKKVK